MLNATDDYFYSDVNIKKSEVLTSSHILGFISFTYLYSKLSTLLNVYQ